MRNKYSKEFENDMFTLATDNTLDELLKVARCKYHYTITKDQLQKYLSKRQIKYKGFNYNRVREMGKDVPLFTERVKSDGMTQIKIAPNKWEYKQRYIYSQYYNEKLTNNDYIIFLDQNRNNFDITNLKKITRHESSILANEKLFSKNKDVTKTGILVAKLMIKTKEKEKLC